jgi:hypothetical protein
MAERLEDLLFGLEEKFWLEGAEHYAGHLSPAAVMVFPDPAGVRVKDGIQRSVSGVPRWRDVALEEHRLIELNDGAALVTYKATARRDGQPDPYVARASSAYVRDGRSWKLAFHQQTPL